MPMVYYQVSTSERGVSFANTLIIQFLSAFQKSDKTPIRTLYTRRLPINIHPLGVSVAQKVNYTTEIQFVVYNSILRIVEHTDEAMTPKTVQTRSKVQVQSKASSHHILLFRTGPNSLAFALSSCFLILPVAVFGSGPNTTDLGTQ